MSGRTVRTLEVEGAAMSHTIAEVPDSLRDRIRRLRHALEVSIGSMAGCTCKYHHRKAYELAQTELHKDKRIALRHKLLNEERP